MPSTVDPTNARTTGPIDLVYVVGAHKSGATILGSILSNAPGVFFAGELYRFPYPIFDPGNPERRCSCGAAVIDCPYWSGLARHSRSTPNLLPELRRGQLRFERWSHLPSTWWAAARNDPTFRANGARMAEFVRLAAAEDGARTVVETSFSPLRAWLYARSAPRDRLRVRFLHLVRDGRGFLSSELAITNDPEAPRWVFLAPVVVARWVGSHALAMLFSLQGRSAYRRIRYEDYVTDPDRTLAEVGDWLGIDLTAVRTTLREGGALPMRHVIAGNRVRLTGEVRLRRELAVPKSLPRGVTALFWSFGGWLALALGYRPNPPTGATPAAK